MSQDLPAELLETIGEAFSRTAEEYDEFARGHPHLTRMRQKVYAHLARHIPANASILELSSGTGTDAVQLALQGHSVHAVDISSGMLTRLRDKVRHFKLSDSISWQRLSFDQMHKIDNGPFDVVFSNLGGLNCIRDLKPVIDQLPTVLKPGGTVTWVLMPKICLWELATFFRGDFDLALRRLRLNGTTAHLQGLYFPVYYFSPYQVKRLFGPSFKLVAIEGLSVITPTAENKHLAINHPNVYSALAWLDDLVSPYWPWHGWGDFFIITMEYRPHS